MALIDATWVSSPATKPSGDLVLGRIKLSDDAQGTFKFRVGLDNSEATFYLGGVIVDGVMLLMAPIPGDAADAAILAGHWQQTVVGGYSVGDFDKDGDIDAADATILAANWQVSVGAEAAVPEPGLVCMLFAGLVALLCGSRGPRY